MRKCMNAFKKLLSCALTSAMILGSAVPASAMDAGDARDDSVTDGGIVSESSRIDEEESLSLEDDLQSVNLNSKSNVRTDGEDAEEQPIEDREIIDQGNCGPHYYSDGGDGWEDNVKYVVYSDGTMVFSGSGKMLGESLLVPPWYYSCREKIKRVVIQSGITWIGHDAFYCCENLESIDIPDSIVYISDKAFYKCSKLKTLDLPNSVNQIGSEAFAYCTSIKTVTFPEQIEWIGGFEYSGLTNITIPSGTKGISGFEGCEHLQSVTLQEGLESIAGACFLNCEALTSLFIPASVTTISSEAIGYHSLDGVDSYQHTVLNSDFTIYGYMGTEAERYANDNGIPFIDVEDNNPDLGEGYVVGNVSAVDESSRTAVIDGTSYRIAGGVDLSGFKDIAGSDSKTVIAIKRGNMLTTLDWVKNVVEPEVNLRFGGIKSAVYQNGAFETSSFDIDVVESIGVKKPYTNEMLDGVEDAAVTISKITFKNNEKAVTFSEVGSSKKKASLKLKLDKTLKVGDKDDQACEVNIKEDYVPDSTNSSLSFEVTLDTSLGKIASECKLPVGNLDVAYSKREENKSVKTAQDALKNSSDLGVAVELGFSSSYLAQSEIKNIERCITAWVADLVAVRSLVEDDDTGILDKIKEWAKISDGQLVSAAFSKLGVNAGLLTKLTRTKASTQIITKDKKGKEVTVYVALDMGYFAFQDDAPYGGFGDITISLKDLSGHTHSNIDKGIVTYSSMNTFVEKLKSVAESGIKGVYDAAWGKNADKVAELLVGEPITKVVKAFGYSFSGGIFSLFSNPGKKAAKEVAAHCPVDVFVYDDQGTLVGSIVDNEVVQDDDELFLCVDGDEKYVYLTNGDYTFKLVGTGEGTMSYDITSYVDGEVERVIEYKDVPLANDTTYYGYVPENLYNEDFLYDLVGESGDGLPASSDSYNAPSQVFAESVSLDSDNITLYVGDKRTLSATVLPANTTNGLLKWSSSNEDVVKVDESSGEIKAVAKGAATVTATTLDGCYAECHVEVLGKDGEPGNPDDTQDPGGMEDSGNTEYPGGTEDPGDTQDPGDDENNESTLPQKGFIIKDGKHQVSYKVLKRGKTVAFHRANNKNLSKLSIPSKVTYQGKTYKVTAISDNAFAGCKKLKSVTISKSVKTIGSKAFSKCTALRKIAIPANVTKIGKRAFYDCRNLKSIVIKTKKLKAKSVGAQAFAGVSKKAVVKVPSKKKAEYRKWLVQRGISQSTAIRS